MLILELCQVIHVLVNDDIEIVGFVMRCHITGRECLGHGDEDLWSGSKVKFRREYSKREVRCYGAEREVYYCCPRDPVTFTC